MTKMFQNLALSRAVSPEIRRIKELKKEAAAGSKKALRELRKIGYKLITINGKQIDLTEMFW